ncbi:MAG: hypothetical protein R2826_10235 [Thermoleophilia bacterium]
MSRSSDRAAVSAAPPRVLIVRNVALAVLGALLLLLESMYRGSFEDVVHSWVGNFVVSFAIYFAILNTTMRWSRPRLYAAGLALLAVEAFEATNGFGILANVYDPADFLVNAIGVGVAVLVDVLTADRLIQWEKRRQEAARRAAQAERAARRRRR